MPLFIDIHEIPGITSDQAAAGHIADIEIQGPFDVNYSKYWFNEETGKIFCLCEAPNADAAIAVHRQAHGTGADRIIEVTPELAEMFLGPAKTDPAGAVVLPSHSGKQLDPGVRTILFTDIVGSTQFTQRFGDDVALELVMRHDRVVRAAIAEFGGREIKHTGDGIMAVFLSAVAATRCAMRVQSELARTAADDCATPPLQVRIGASAGEPVEHHDDLFGATVQLAARLCAHAAPTQILVSSVVAALCLGKGITFADAGDLELKGFTGGISAQAVDWSTPPPA